MSQKQLNRFIDKYKYKTKINEQTSAAWGDVTERKCITIVYCEPLHHNTLKNMLKGNMILSSDTSNKLEKQFNRHKTYEAVDNRYNPTVEYKISWSECPSFYQRQIERSFLRRVNPKSGIRQNVGRHKCA